MIFSAKEKLKFINGRSCIRLILGFLLVLWGKDAKIKMKSSGNVGL